MKKQKEKEVSFDVDFKSIATHNWVLWNNYNTLKEAKESDVFVTTEGTRIRKVTKEIVLEQKK